MNILLVSQCDKRALTETRRILDQFAERRGDRTWQTPITQAGLDTLRKLLKKTARKNTSVACHWIRGLDHSELLWIVGDASRFNTEGAVPTDTTRRNVLRAQDENNWHTGEAIYLLSTLAALLHDLGKSCDAFQARLKPGAPIARNLYRHEWISLRLFQAFVGNDDDAGWLARLIAPNAEDDASWLAPSRLQRDGLQDTTAPLANLPPLARALGWLIVSHHRQPVMPTQQEDGRPKWLGAKASPFQSTMLQQVLARLDAQWNERCEETDPRHIAPYWQFAHGLPTSTPGWRKRAAKLAKRLVDLQARHAHVDWLDNPYVAHIARLCLMLADHHYSSLTDPGLRIQADQNYPLVANTHRKTGLPNQRLDEHLLGVESHCALVSHALPDFERHLPRLARHKGLKKRSADERYRWQDKAAELANSMRDRATRQGAFIVNMASTGCGKTLANARIMYGLADPQHGMRCTFALGLRTLTLQTGQAYRDLLHLGDDDLAIRVGGAPNRELFKLRAQQAESAGSASSQALFPEDSYVRFDGNAELHPLLNRVMHDPNVRSLLAAPMLVCTIDHLIPATDSQRGGAQIGPMLRLMSSDLVLDEPDDFDLADLPALSRLVHWAGMLGARVLLSSATLPPALTEGLFDSYRDGRAIYQRNRDLQASGDTLSVCCAWVDEFHHAQHDCIDTDTFRASHDAFVRKRHASLSKALVRRRGELLSVSFSSPRRETTRSELASVLLNHAVMQHQHHRVKDPHSSKHASFGLIRMANIDPIVDVALAMYRHGAPAGIRMHLCVYHSQFPLLIRSAIEYRLDQALDRRDADAVFDRADIRQHLDAHAEPDHIFLVLGSPVTEVGRDHDYDWAIAEPSSMRSLIQLAGRVRRHRPVACDLANVLVLSRNLRSVERPGEAAFCRPGFEGDDAFRLMSHHLPDLIATDELAVLDARPRILARAAEHFNARTSLVDLEHARLRQQMNGPPARTMSARELRAMSTPPVPPLSAASWWQLPRQDALYTGVIPQQQPFREDTRKRIELVLRLNDEEDDYGLCERVEERGQADSYVEVERSLNGRIPDAQVTGTGIGPWGVRDYMEELHRLAVQLDMPVQDCALRFGTVTLPESQDGWRFHPSLGFSSR